MKNLTGLKDVRIVMIKLNGHEIKPTIFPDGTSQVWKIDDILFYPFVGFSIMGTFTYVVFVWALSLIH